MKRTALITGASSGIGRACAQRLLQQGHTVIGTSRDIARFETTHPQFHPLALDLNQLTELPAKMQSLLRDFPVLDTVIFAAGYGQFGSLEEFSFAQIEALITVNFTAQIFITRALLPKLKQQNRSQLIYIGSEAALKGSRKGSIYCAGKFALRGFTQALRDECGKTGIRVTLINPGMVATPFFDNLSFMPGEDKTHALQADDIAQAIEYLIQSSPAINIDEINLNPANKVIQFKKN